MDEKTLEKLREIVADCDVGYLAMFELSQDEAETLYEGARAYLQIRDALMGGPKK